MKCMHCGEGDLGKPERMNVPYKALPGTVLVDVEVRRCPRCGDHEVAIPRIEELDRLLARAVASHRGRLTPHEVRYLRKYLGWSGRDFARLFDVDPATVSRWESGAQQMDPRAERLLRLCATRLEPIEDYAELEELLRQPEEGPEPRPIRVLWNDGWRAEAA